MYDITNRRSFDDVQDWMDNMTTVGMGRWECGCPLPLGGGGGWPLLLGRLNLLTPPTAWEFQDQGCTRGTQE